MRADGVFSGGGVKGLAFAGAIKGAEEAGYDEWVNLGGTSAGAITAMALAAGYDAAGLKLLFSFDLGKLDDRGGPFGVGVVRNYFHHGITRGKELSTWIASILAGAPDAVDGRPPATFPELKRTLKVVGSDLVHQRMVVFPDDAALYLDDDGTPYTPQTFPIALAVRISAGYPGFFPPVPLRDAATGTRGALVDGGVTANFPVFLYDDPDPKWPTWAFRLYAGDAPQKPAVDPIKGLLWPVDMLGDVLDTAMNALDGFELKLFGDRIITIPTGSLSALHFSLSKPEETVLYDSGLHAARTFFAAKPKAKNRFGANPPII